MEQHYSTSSIFKKSLLAAAIGTTIALTGCSGNSSSDDDKKTSEASVSLSGYAIKGVMINADIKVYDLATNTLLKETTTDAQGQYSLSDITVESETVGALKVVMTTNTNTTTKCDSAIGCSDGSGNDVSFGQTYSFHDPGFQLTAILADPQNATSASLMVTPLTHMSAARIEKEGTLTSEAIRTVNRETAVLMGLGNVDIATLQPVDLASPNSAAADSNAVKYGAMLAAVATVAKEKGLSLQDMVQQLSDNYASSKGLKSHSSNDQETDLADLFAAAVESLNTAESTFNIDIDNTAEVVMMSKRNDAANATVDDVTVIDSSNTGEVDPTLTPQEQATLKGMALLEDLNTWNDTQLDIRSQLLAEDGELTQYANDLDMIATAVQEQTDLARAFSTLAYGFTEQEVVETETYCAYWGPRNCQQWEVEEYSWTEEQQSGILAGVPNLIREFAYLTNEIESDHDELETTFDNETQRYTLILDDQFVEEYWDEEYFAESYGFIYGYAGSGADNIGELDISYAMNDDDEITDIRFSGTSGYPEGGKAIELNTLQMQPSMSMDDARYAVTIAAMSLNDTTTTSLLNKELEVGISYTATGELSMEFVDFDALDDALFWDDGDTNKLLNMTLTLDSEVSENAEDAAAGGFSPASGELDVNVSFKRDSIGAEATATMAAKVDVRNSNGDFITGQLTGSGQASSPAPKNIAADMNFSFTGSLSQGVHDADHALNGASTRFDGTLTLDIPNIQNDHPSTYTTTFDGELSVQDAAGTGAAFDGNAKLAMEHPKTASGHPLYSERAGNYFDYYWFDIEAETTEAAIPTEVALTGKLTASRENTTKAELDIKASLMLDNLAPVVARLDQGEISYGHIIGTPPDMIGGGSSLDEQGNRITFELHRHAEDDLIALAAEYIQTLGLTNTHYFTRQSVGEMTSELSVDASSCTPDDGVYFCDLNITETRYEYSSDNSAPGTRYPYNKQKSIEFTTSEFEANDHLSPAKWQPKAMATINENMWLHAEIEIHSDQGYIHVGKSESDFHDNIIEPMTVGHYQLVNNLHETIASGETADSYVGIAASLEIALDAFEYEDASIQLVTGRTSQVGMEGQLTLKYGARSIDMVLAVEDSQLDTSKTALTISNNDTEMKLTAECIDLASEKQTTRSALSKCDNDDLNFGGTITVDGLEIGKLEDRNGLPVFVFGDDTEYQMIATPAFLISRQ